MNTRHISLLILIISTAIVEAAPPAWIDLPLDDYSVLSKISHEMFNYLNNLVIQYHGLGKQNIDLLIERIRLLGIIVQYLDDWLMIETKILLRKFLGHIRNIGLNKMRYLNDLKLIFDKDHFSSAYLVNYHTDTTGIMPGYKPIYLHNSQEYDSFNGQYWGEYWMETIDPCHRQLTTFHKSWGKRNPDAHLGSFFLWLEEQNLSKDILYLNFMTDPEIMSQKVLVHNGLMYFNIPIKSNLIDYSDDSKEYIFNIDLSGNIILVTATKQTHHVSMSRGKPVLGCGNMVIHQGIIIKIELESGHYLPTVQDGLQTISILRNKGIDIRHDIEFSYYEGGCKNKTTINEFESSHAISP